MSHTHPHNAEALNMLQAVSSWANSDTQGVYESRFSVLNDQFKSLYKEAARHWVGEYLGNLVKAFKEYDTGKILDVRVERQGNDEATPIKKVSVVHRGEQLLEITPTEQPNKAIGILAVARYAACYAEAEPFRRDMFLHGDEFRKKDQLPEFICSAIGDKLLLPPVVRTEILMLGRVKPRGLDN